MMKALRRARLEADGGGLENRYGATHRGFESHALRSLTCENMSVSLRHRVAICPRRGLQGNQRSPGAISTLRAMAPKRAETEKAARNGATESVRETLRRHVRIAAAGAFTEADFWRRLREQGVVVRQRFSE